MGLAQEVVQNLLKSQEEQAKAVEFNRGEAMALVEAQKIARGVADGVKEKVLAELIAYSGNSNDRATRGSGKPVETRGGRGRGRGGGRGRKVKYVLEELNGVYRTM
ncbi:hypothetical protein HDV00_004220 [Rhizophlyctis rosea]|nr:hypothetical protein HDV00_004220 [Rhizophlyctis rosea]